MERIAVGLSDPASQRAVDWAIERAMSRPVETTLVAAYDWLLTPRRQVSELLRAARERIAARSARTRVNLSAVEDDALRTLIEASAHSDLLVIGARLRHRLELLAEAPALRIARRARCATVIVPEGWTPTDHGIVVVGAGDESSTSAIEFAALEAEHRGAHLEIVRAWTNPVSAYDALLWSGDTEGKLRASNRGSLDDLMSRTERRHPTVHLASLLAETAPGAALLQRAARADLVVIGSHRRGPLAALLVGSTAHDLLGRTSAALCIVPNAANASEPVASSPAASAHGR